MDDLDEARTKLIANERAKLTATYANGVAIAILAIGGLAPLFAQRIAVQIIRFPLDPFGDAVKRGSPLLPGEGAPTRPFDPK